MARGSTPFCSPACGTRCNGNLNNQCANSCQSTALWIVSGTSCAPKTASNWIIWDSSPDYNSGTLAVAGATQSYTCKDMNIYGLVPSVGSTISVSTPAITTPYFQLQFYVGIIAIDVTCGGGGGCGGIPKSLWSWSTAFSTSFNDPDATQTATNPIVTLLKSPSAKNRLCSIVSTDVY